MEKVARRLTALSIVLLAAGGCGYETAASPPTAAGVQSQSVRVGTSANSSVSQPSPASEAVASVDAPPPVDPASVEAATEDSRAETEEPASNPHAEQVAAPATPATRGKAPKADRAPRRPGEAEKITFEDLFLNMPADIVFRPFMLSDRARELDGQRVSIIGYMHGGATGNRVKEFILLRNTECKFGPGGQADHLAQIFLRSGQTTEYNPDPFKVEGTLKIEPYQGADGNTWSIYRLEDAVIR